MKSSMCIDSALHNKGLSPTCPERSRGKGTVPYKERMVWYKTFAAAFSYPDDNFLKCFPQVLPQKGDLLLEYDRLFRSGEIWLYGCEYTAENEFQRAQILADINGFYKAFGLETDRDRPDSLPCELEFMHYLIYKQMNAPDKEKAFTCFSAQKKFFVEHLLPSARKMLDALLAKSKNNFYREIAQNLLAFLANEEEFLKGRKQ